MKTAHMAPASHGITRREGLLSLLGTAMTLAGCGGGGGGVAGVSSGGTGSFSVGAISGFGSVIVNGVRFEDMNALVSDDDGVPRSRSDLKLGMVVRVRGSSISSGPSGRSGRADTIIFGSELVGPISSVSPSTRTLVVLGQTVEIRGSTVFEDGLSSDLGALDVLVRASTPVVIEVNGFVDPVANRIMATRIELRNSPNLYRIEGLVRNFNGAAGTFDIGSLAIRFDATTDVRVTLAENVLVRVRLVAVVPAPAVFTAQRIRPPEEPVEDRDEAEVEGMITAFTTPSAFFVNGLQIDARQAAFPDGTAGLAVGARVEVEGRVVNDVLVATKVELEKQIDNLEFELRGLIGNLDAVAKTFVLRGVTVDFSGTATFLPVGRTAANLANNVDVEVKGVAAVNGTGISATQIKFQT